MMRRVKPQDHEITVDQRAMGEEQYEFRLGGDTARRRRAPRTPMAARGQPRPPPSPSKARAPVLARKAGLCVLPADATASEAFRLTLAHCREHIVANIPAVAQGHEVEGVHQLRVALRRLRVALAAFGRDFRTPSLEALRMRAKILAAGLGPARDMDVFLDELLAPAQADASLPEAFAALRTRAVARRAEAWQQAVQTASGLAFHTFLHDLTQAIEQRQWYEIAAPGADPSPLDSFERPVRILADRQLEHHFRKAKKRARKLQTLDEGQRHKLRIALKKLRYTLEFFASVYEPKAVKPFSKSLAQMQDVLGSLQDLAVARSILHGLVEHPPESLLSQQSDVCFAAGTVYGWHLERASQSWSEAKVHWRHLAKAEPFWGAS